MFHLLVAIIFTLVHVVSGGQTTRNYTRSDGAL